MMSFPFAVGGIALAWMVIYGLATGLGCWIAMLLRLRIERAEHAFVCFWLGWASATGVLQLWHFGFPIDGHIAGLLAVAGIAGLWMKRQEWRELLRIDKSPVASFAGRIRLRSSYVYLLLPPIVFWCAAHAAGQIHMYDSGLYHLAVVRWVTEHPLVVGLGNLHGRLAFNNASLLMTSVLDGWFWGFEGYRLSGGVPLLALVAQALWGLGRFVSRDSGMRLPEFFLVCATAVVLPTAWYYLPSTSTDAPGVYLGVIVTYLLFDLLASRRNATDDARLTAVIVVLAALGTVNKFSFVVFGSLTAATACCACIGRHCRSFLARAAAQSVIVGVVCGLALLVPWCVRSVMLSGWLVYPSTLVGFDVAWAVPEAQVVDEAIWIKSWARWPFRHYSEVMGNWNWLQPWFARLPKQDLGLAVIAVAAWGVIAMQFFRASADERRRIGRSAVVLVPALAGAVFWFVTAPDPRFAGAVLLALGFGSLGIAWRDLFIAERRGRLGLVLALLMCVTIDRFRDQPLLPESEKRLQCAPQTDLNIVHTHSGLRLYVPKSGDQVWNAPLPNTPYPNPRLCLRKPGDLSSGFIVDRSIPRPAASPTDPPRVAGASPSAADRPL